MENKINLAAILKDCPRGMELDCSIHTRPVIFNCVKMESDYPIRISSKDGFSHSLTYWGSLYNCEDAKCIIFPKGKTTWEGFAPPCKFKDGDVVISDYGDIHLLRTEDSSYCAYRHIRKNKLDSTITTNITVVRLATEEEKERLFDTIKENGYRWNTETKTLDKLPKFKVGDIIKHKDSGLYCTLEEYSEGISAYRTNIGLSLTHKDLEQWELVPNKFDITTLKPFDKVLVRDSDKDMWCASIFSHTWKDKYFCIDIWHNQCIPYEANKKLLGTTNNPAEYGSE